eukprot:12418646-Karenia_brevis.AAC.1
MEKPRQRKRPLKAPDEKWAQYGLCDVYRGVYGERVEFLDFLVSWLLALPLIPIHMIWGSTA